MDYIISNQETKPSTLHTMPLGNRLSDFGKSQILPHNSHCWSITDIAKEVQRYSAIATSFLRNLDTCNQKNTAGRPPKIPGARKRRETVFSGTSWSGRQ